jgi:hypothetical protein
LGVSDQYLCDSHCHYWHLFLLFSSCARLYLSFALGFLRERCSRALVFPRAVAHEGHVRVRLVESRVARAQLRENGTRAGTAHLTRRDKSTSRGGRPSCVLRATRIPAKQTRWAVRTSQQSTPSAIAKVGVSGIFSAILRT